MVLEDVPREADARDAHPFDVQPLDAPTLDAPTPDAPTPDAPAFDVLADGGTDVPTDEPVPAMCATVSAGDASALSPPTPLGPMSTSRVSSHRPTIRWRLAAGTDGACVELCYDRACTRPIASVAARGDHVRLPAALPPGVAFWRLRSQLGDRAGAATSATWEFVVGVRDAAVDTSSGSMLDVNGDGFADVAVGAGFDRTLGGAVYVFTGGPGGVSATPFATLLGGPRPTDWGGGFGSFVASAGDVNGDGVGDLLAVSADDYESVSIRLYLGGSDGLQPPQVIGDGALLPYTAAMSAGDFDGDGYGDVVLGGPHAPDWQLFRGGPSGLGAFTAVTLIGSSVSTALRTQFTAANLDVNGDGRVDLVASVLPQNLTGLSGPGTIYVYLGRNSGLSEPPDQVINAPAGMLAPNGQFGDLGNAGDLDGDGRDDVVVGQQRPNGAFAYLGTSSGLAASPVVQWADPSAVVSSPDQFGTRIGPAGDVDGDGFDDVVLGAEWQFGSGFVYVYRGGTVLSATPAVTLTSPGAPTIDWFGQALGGGADIDGDGFADVVVGAYGGLLTPGRAYIYRGSAAEIAGGVSATLASPGGSRPNDSFGLSAY